jgi:hypothetical protein
MKGKLYGYEIQPKAQTGSGSGTTENAENPHQQGNEEPASWSYGE